MCNFFLDFFRVEPYCFAYSLELGYLLLMAC